MRMTNEEICDLLFIRVGKRTTWPDGQYNYYCDRNGVAIDGQNFAIYEEYCYCGTESDKNAFLQWFEDCADGEKIYYKGHVDGEMHLVARKFENKWWLQ